MGKRKRVRERNCQQCDADSSVLYRVRTDVEVEWRLLCPNCQKVCAIEAGYQYGGTWKSVKRPRA